MSGSPGGGDMRLKRSRAAGAGRRSPVGSAWRAQVLVDIDDMRTELRWLMARQPPSEDNHALDESALRLLREAEALATGEGSIRQTLSGASVQAAKQYLDAARINLLRLAPEDHLRSLLPNIVMEARSHLVPTDLRLTVLTRIESRELGPGKDLTAADRAAIISAVQGVQAETHREQLRVRSFRNVIVGVTLAITLLVLTVALVGAVTPATLPLCFVPPDLVVCPTTEAPTADIDTFDAVRRTAGPWDATVVLFIGLLGATIAAATGLRNIRGSADPYSLPAALALLKLPTGAFTAYLGILLIRAGFVPGLSALDTSAQIIAYAIILGYSQQLFTGFVDRQAQAVLVEAGNVPPQPPAGRPGGARLRNTSDVD